MQRVLTQESEPPPTSISISILDSNKLCDPGKPLNLSVTHGDVDMTARASVPRFYGVYERFIIFTLKIPLLMVPFALIRRTDVTE